MRRPPASSASRPRTLLRVLAAPKPLLLAAALEGSFRLSSCVLTVLSSTLCLFCSPNASSSFGPLYAMSTAPSLFARLMVAPHMMSASAGSCVRVSRKGTPHSRSHANSHHPMLISLSYYLNAHCRQVSQNLPPRLFSMA
ncbi:hypothetical protein AcW2_006362 [Taiwanofungus camphoratus]|nr:hypothetical protein AcW2_006362 [Antrodia cinnamomea]